MIVPAEKVLVIPDVQGFGNTLGEWMGFSHWGCLLPVELLWLSESYSLT